MFSSIKYIDDLVPSGSISRTPETFLKPETRDKKSTNENGSRGRRVKVKKLDTDVHLQDLHVALIAGLQTPSKYFIGEKWKPQEKTHCHKSSMLANTCQEQNRNEWSETIFS